MASLFLLLIIICACVNVALQNILKNPSFETDDYWTLNVRTSMWNVETAHENRLHYSSGKSRGGSRSLHFKPPLDAAEAVYISQFIPVPDSIYTSPADQRSLPLQFSVWSAGKRETHLLRFLLDIRYKDGRYFLVETKLERTSGHSGSRSAEFTHHCVVIPGYGHIEAIMVHVVIEGKFTEDIWVDEISVEFTGSKIAPDGICKLYLDSYPPSRIVLNNFLSAATPRDASIITLATQLTVDRLNNLEDAAGFWRGPISAVLFLPGMHDVSKTLPLLVRRYTTSEYLSKYVTIHVVFEDKLNLKDTTLYPVNFLRNIAIKNAVTEFVFLTDADAIPSFSAANADTWMRKANALLLECRADMCAYIVPTFYAKTIGVPIPGNKHALLAEVNREGGSLAPISFTSHSVTRYHHWMTTDEPYAVDYREDMEPYFIVHRNAPLMTEMFVGYGRDKCVYSKEVHHAGYKFVVLSEPFLIDRQESSGSRTIWDRSGLRLRVFLSIAFHNAELQRKYAQTTDKDACAKGKACGSHTSFKEDGSACPSS